MIRQRIDRLNALYNSYSRGTQVALLSGFCLVFLLLLGLAVRYIDFDIRPYPTKIPAHIGRPSGPEFKDSIKH